MKFNFKVFLGSLTVILLMFTFTNFQKVSAQIPENAEMDTVLMATVNIYNATNTKINNKTYSISFDLTNREGIQPNIRYGVQLIRAYTNKPIDMYLVNESISLGENDKKNLTIEYTLPGYIPDGDYRLLIVTQNQNGLPLATSPIGFPEKLINITNTSGINIDKCILFVNEEDPRIEYASGEGVAIRAEEETLTASCEITNSSLKSDNLKLQLITHKRDQFGDILANNILEQTVSVKAKSNQRVEFLLPVLKTPQAYDIDTFLINNEGKKVSYSVFLHYVVSGSSATIQNTLLDKTDYKMGDIAELKVFWTASADTFTNSRLAGTEDTYSIKGVIKSSAGEVCGSLEKEVKTPEILGENILKIRMNKDCPAAIAEISIINSKGDLLDSTKIDLNNQITNVQINANIPTEAFSFANFNAIYIVIFIATLVLIAYAILRLRKKEVENK